MDISKIKPGKTVHVSPPRGYAYIAKVISVDDKRLDGAWVIVERKVGTGKAATTERRKVRPGYLT